MNCLQQEYDSYAVEEPSDDEHINSSSEDELDVLLHGTPEQKRKLIRECLTGESESSSEDDFKKEMEKELSSTMRTIEGSWKPLGLGTSTNSAESPAGGSTQQYYDDIYFDSDSDEEASGHLRKQKRKVLSNDDLLYDPQEDERDQAWVDAKRRGYRNMSKPTQTTRPQTKVEPLPSSDAILNCPACMTTLCLDCQRHESYRTQYRAMFVMNCTINTEELLKFPDQPSKQRRRDRKKMKAASSDAVTKTQNTDMYHPVKCNTCSTEVAVYDKDEVYHFFNVLASHC